MPVPHILRMTDKLMKDAASNYYVKWEGFNSDFDIREPEGEKADEIYKNPKEAKIPGYEFASPTGVVKEGRYLLQTGLTRKADETQRQRYQVRIEAGYGVNFTAP